MASAWYCTREDVKSSPDFKEVARNNEQIDRAIAAATRSVEGLTHRKFYPEIDTRYFDWPNQQYARSWRLWLDGNEVVSVSSLVSGGETVSASDYFLEPNTYGPPYNRIEMDLGSSAAFSTGDTHQRSIAVSGTFGYTDEVENASTLAASGSSSATSLTVASSTYIGVGQILKIDSEYLLVTEKRYADTTQNLQTPLTSAKSDVSVVVSNGTVFNPGDVVVLDSERMKVIDVIGNTLTVVRAWDGTVLAAHTGSDIYLPVSLTVKRGALGSTAATHANGATVSKVVIPELVRELAIAEAINILLQASSGYARSESGESNNPADIGRGLQGLRDQVKRLYGRKARIRGA